MPALRGLFLLAVPLFAWLGLRGRFDEVSGALADTSASGVLVGLLLVLLGLFATGLLWQLLVRSLGAELPLRDGMAIFYVGQLGKYIPGSVWSIGAQADMARRHTVPPRVTVVAGLLFLGYHVDTAVLLGSVSLLSGALDSPWPDWLSWLGLGLGLIGLLPPLVRALGRHLGDREPALDAARTLLVVVLMGTAWAAYAGALVLLSPGTPWMHTAALGGAFAIAYAVGVVIVLAPAGVGAREAVFILLLTPVLGVGPATALALVARVAHTVADGVMAGGWWLMAGPRRQASRSSTSENRSCSSPSGSSAPSSISSQVRGAATVGKSPPRSE